MPVSSRRPKVVCIGDAGVGKTSLIRALAREPLNLEEPPTELRAVRDVQLPGSEEKAEVWDCGQIIDENDLHRLLDGAGIVLLMFDDANSFYNVESIWVEAVSRHASRDCFVMLVRCKSDLKGSLGEDDEVVLEHVESFARQTGTMLIECSAKDRNNIAVLLNVLSLRIVHESTRQPPPPPSSPPPPPLPPRTSPPHVTTTMARDSTTHLHSTTQYRDTYDHTQRVLMERAQQNNSPTKLKLHRSGSIDLTNLATGVQVHVANDGKFNVSHGDHSIMPMLTNGGGGGGGTNLDSSLVSAEQPLLVDVTLGAGVLGTLYFYRDDDPYVAASEFLERHGMDQARAPELARIVSARVNDFIASEEEKSSAPANTSRKHHAPPPVAAPVLAKLKVPLPGNKSVTVQVREGDNVYQVVDTFQRQYDIRKTDPLLSELTRRVEALLLTSRGGGNSSSIGGGTFEIRSDAGGSLTDSQRDLLLRTLVVSPSPSATTPVDTPDSIRPLPASAALSWRSGYYPAGGVGEPLDEYDDNDRNSRDGGHYAKAPPSLSTTTKEIGVNGQPTDWKWRSDNDHQHETREMGVEWRQYHGELHAPMQQPSMREFETREVGVESPAFQPAPRARVGSSSDSESTFRRAATSPSPQPPPPTTETMMQQQQQPPPPPTRYRAPSSSSSTTSSNGRPTTTERAPFSTRQSPTRRPVVVGGITRPSPIRGVTASTRSTTRRVPFFIVDVEISPGLTDKLSVFKDDNLANKAIEFCKQQGLPMTKAFKLQQLLEHQMKVHISRLKKGG